MNFSQALESLKLGSDIARSGWNGKNMYLNLVPARPEDKKLAFIQMRTVQGNYVPWLASQTDLLVDDWEIKLL